MNSKPPHLLAACILVNTTGVIISALIHRSLRRLVSVAAQLVGGHKVVGLVDHVSASSHHYQVRGYLNSAVGESMPDNEGPWLGRRAIPRDPLCAV